MATAAAQPAAALDKLLAFADRVAQRAAWFGGFLIFLAAIVVSIDVVARKLFTVSLGGADELSGYALAIGCAWAFAFTLLRRANVRVDVLYAKLPRQACAVLDILALVALGVFVALLARYAFDVAQQSFTRNALSNTQLKTPLWIPQSLWFLGLALFLATLGLMLLRGVVALVGGDWAAINKMFGARSAEEDAEEEAAYAKEMAAREAASIQPAQANAPPGGKP